MLNNGSEFKLKLSMNVKYINLNNRAIIYIKGPDRKNFVQGLVTNDVNNIVDNAAIYAVMLNPQGRFWYDFFITESEEMLLLDCAKSSVDSLIKKLSFYKLRAQVEIGKMDDFLAVSILNEPKDQKLNFLTPKVIHFNDPRSAQMGIRLMIRANKLQELVRENNISEADLDFYNHHRLQTKIVDDSDLVVDQSLILEYGFDNLNAIDYNKGCYVGQEVTARTHYRGLVRKKVFLVEIENLKEIAAQSEITESDKKVGIILSSVFWEGKLMALALIRNVDNSDQEIDLKKVDLKVMGVKISLVS